VLKQNPRFLGLACAAVLLVGGYRFFATRPVTYGPGVVAPDAPIQKNLTDAEGFEHDGYQIEPLAEFWIKARVLSKTRYRWDAGAELAPFDFAMGWGPMSDESVLDHITIEQRNRFYFWRTPKFPIPRRDIETSSANMHLIPSTGYVRSTLARVRVGEVVEIEGYLIRALRDDGWRWKSSLTREDVGDGSCEVIWVETAEVVPATPIP